MNKDFFANYKTHLKKFWNTCGRGTAHVDRHWIGKVDVKEWKEKISQRYQIKPEFFRNKTVIDYGIGSGYLGWVLHQWKIKKYIGLDIAERQIEAAKKYLKGIPNCEFHLVPVELRQFKADIFVSHACIQHFPDQEYLDEFLDNLNKSGVHDILIQYRYGEQTYFKQDKPRLACRTNSVYINKKLNNYQLKHISEIGRADYQSASYRLLGSPEHEVN